MQIICIRYTAARAGLICSALLQYVAVDFRPLLMKLSIQLLAPTGALHEEMLDPRLADTHKETLALPIRDWNYAAEHEAVASGVVPER